MIPTGNSFTPVQVALYWIVIVLGQGSKRQLANLLLEHLAHQFGGYTLAPGKGGWVSPLGEFCQDEVSLVLVAARRDEATEQAIALCAAQLAFRLGEAETFVVCLPAEELSQTVNPSVDLAADD